MRASADGVILNYFTSVWLEPNSTDKTGLHIDGHFQIITDGVKVLLNKERDRTFSHSLLELFDQFFMTVLYTLKAEVCGNDNSDWFHSEN